MEWASDSRRCKLCAKWLAEKSISRDLKGLQRKEGGLETGTVGKFYMFGKDRYSRTG